jgi:hypothetical protein
MKAMILSTILVLVIASPVHATPLTWIFTGMTLPNSSFMGNDISGKTFQLQIFLDTDFVGTQAPQPAEWFFRCAPVPVPCPPVIGQVIIPLDPPLPSVFALNPFVVIEYFATTGLFISFVDLQQFPGSGKQFINFDPPIDSVDFLLVPARLGPIAPRAPSTIDTLEFVGPDLFVRGQVTEFSAVLGVPGLPEPSTAMLLTSGLVALGFLWRRYKGSATN